MSVAGGNTSLPPEAAAITRMPAACAFSPITAANIVILEIHTSATKTTRPLIRKSPAFCGYWEQSSILPWQAVGSWNGGYPIFPGRSFRERSVTSRAIRRICRPSALFRRLKNIENTYKARYVWLPIEWWVHPRVPEFQKVLSCADRLLRRDDIRRAYENLFCLYS